MTLTEVTALVNNRIGNLVSYDTTIQTKLEFVKSTKLERDPILKPWFLEYSSAATLVSGATTYTLPTDYLGAEPDSYLRKTAEKGFYKRIRPEQAEEVDETCTKVYYMRGTTVTFQPALTEDTSMTQCYYQATGTLASTPTTNPWLLYAADLLAAETAYEFLMDFQDVEGARLQATAAQQARNRIIAENIERQLGTQV